MDLPAPLPEPNTGGDTPPSTTFDSQESIVPNRRQKGVGENEIWQVALMADGLLLRNPDAVLVGLTPGRKSQAS